MINTKPITLEAKNYSCIMILTNDFVSANILSKYKTVKIVTQQLNNKWISNIYYKGEIK